MTHRHHHESREDLLGTPIPDHQLRLGTLPPEIAARLRTVSRRNAVKLLALSGAAALTGCGSSVSAVSSSATTTATTTSSSDSTATCSKGTTLTEGPYWVDGVSNTPLRSDVRPDTLGATTSASTGVPLSLTFAVYTYATSGCSPLQYTRVDIWSADSRGLYSDEAALKTADENFLRGYQISDADGLVSFTTVVPNWYSGRTPHIHLRFRTYDSSGAVLTNNTTQVFFDETVNAAVEATSAYARSTKRDTTNASDNLYRSNLLLTLSGSPTAGYTGATYGVGLPFG